MPSSRARATACVWLVTCSLPDRHQRTTLLRAFQDKLRDPDGIDPHRHMTPALLFDPPGVRRELVQTPPPLEEDPIAITKRHRHGNGDAPSGKRSARLVEGCFESPRGREIIHGTQRVTHGHTPASYRER